jgi:hypothetical protein
MWGNPPVAYGRDLEEAYRPQRSFSVRKLTRKSVKISQVRKYRILFDAMSYLRDARFREVNEGQGALLFRNAMKRVAAAEQPTILPQSRLP